jgi:glycosyltransferase involved in cell wall biosynthesis
MGQNLEKRQSISILIPAYNEEAIIREVVTGLRKRYPEDEIIVVDDGSDDGTFEALSGVDATVIQHKSNSGYGASWKTLCEAAKNEIIVYYDGDGQFDPDDIERLIREFHEQKADLVSGMRARGSDKSLIRQPGKWALGLVANILMRKRIPDVNCGLRVFRKPHLETVLPLLPSGFSASTTSLLAFMHQRLKVCFVPIITKKRVGSSSVHILRDGFNTLVLILRTIMLFSPLRVFLPVSLFMVFSAIVYSVYEILVNDQGLSVLGSTIFVGGIIVFFIGMVTDQISALRMQLLEIKRHQGG